MSLVTDFQVARDALYEHCGFKEDWISFPIELGYIDAHWRVDKDTVTFATSLDDLASLKRYSAELVKHRLYPKGAIYRGDEFTLIIGDPYTDNCRWLYVFRTALEAK
jgi:hypothetical protein